MVTSKLIEKFPFAPTFPSRFVVILDSRTGRRHSHPPFEGCSFLSCTEYRSLEMTSRLWVSLFLSGAHPPYVFFRLLIPLSSPLRTFTLFCFPLWWFFFWVFGWGVLFFVVCLFCFFFCFGFWGVGLLFVGGLGWWGVCVVFCGFFWCFFFWVGVFFVGFFFFFWWFWGFGLWGGCGVCLGCWVLGGGFFWGVVSFLPRTSVVAPFLSSSFDHELFLFEKGGRRIWRKFCSRVFDVFSG